MDSRVVVVGVSVSLAVLSEFWRLKYTYYCIVLYDLVEAKIRPKYSRRRLNWLVRVGLRRK